MSGKVCLVVIDGWGVNEQHTHDGPGVDAIRDARTPVMDELCRDCPNTLLRAHGRDVGLPENLMGNSEVGHLNIGAGRVVFQDIVRIDLAIERNELFTNAALGHLGEECKRNNRPVHLVGLLSDGGVHSHMSHLKALLSVLHAMSIGQVYIHAITDGRDVGPKTAIKYLEDISSFCCRLNYGRLASLIGRYYAMDRDKRYERTKAAHDLYTKGIGSLYSSYTEAIETNYLNGVTDEFVKPSLLPDFHSIKNQDGVVFFNFRSDRMRQIVSAFLGEAEDFTSMNLVHSVVLSP